MSRFSFFPKSFWGAIALCVLGFVAMHLLLCFLFATLVFAHPTWETYQPAMGVAVLAVDAFVFSLAASLFTQKPLLSAATVSLFSFLFVVSIALLYGHHKTEFAAVAIRFFVCLSCGVAGGITPLFFQKRRTKGSVKRRKKRLRTVG